MTKDLFIREKINLTFMMISEKLTKGTEMWLTEKRYIYSIEERYITIKNIELTEIEFLTQLVNKRNEKEEN